MKNQTKQYSETRAASLVWAQLRQASEPNRREANEGLRRLRSEDEKILFSEAPQTRESWIMDK